MLQFKQKLDELVQFIDFRLVSQPDMSAGLGMLLHTLKVYYFDGNPVETNKQVKASLFRLLLESYKHDLRQQLHQRRLDSLDDSYDWRQRFERQMGKFGDKLAAEPIVYECKNKSDMNMLLEAFVDSLLQEFLQFVNNKVA